MQAAENLVRQDCRTEGIIRMLIQNILSPVLQDTFPMAMKLRPTKILVKK